MLESTSDGVQKRTAPEAERITERDQQRPADWPKNFPEKHFSAADIATPKDQWKWRAIGATKDDLPDQETQTSVAVLYGETQLAVFNVPGRGLYACQQMCPHSKASRLGTR
jgi:nitrite reductase (NAD(P)H)